MAPRAELPLASNFNDLHCQPDVTARFDRQRVFPALSNLTVGQDDRQFPADQWYEAPGPVVPDIYAQLGAKSRLLPNPFHELGPVEREDSGVEAGTLNLLPVNGSGRSGASLPEETALISSSRHPYRDAARALIAAGNDPTTAFALRAHLGTAAMPAVDEARLVVASWKPFSPSVVSSSIRRSRSRKRSLRILRRLHEIADARHSRPASGRWTARMPSRMPARSRGPPAHPESTSSPRRHYC